MPSRQITTEHLNMALDLAAAKGARAKDITEVIVHNDRQGVTVCLGADAEGLAHFVSNRGFGL